MQTCRNVTVANRRTSIRLEDSLWDAVDDLCHREGLTVHELCSALDRYRGDRGLTAALRVFTVTYFRHAASHPPEPAPVRGPVRALQPFRRRPKTDRRGIDLWRPRIETLFATP